MRYKISKDYLMNSDMKKFDNYNMFDVMGIEHDLSEILNDNEIAYNDKVLIANRYNEIINYIIDNLVKNKES